MYPEIIGNRSLKKEGGEEHHHHQGIESQMYRLFDSCIGTKEDFGAFEAMCFQGNL